MFALSAFGVTSNADTLSLHRYCTHTLTNAWRVPPPYMNRNAHLHAFCNISPKYTILFFLSEWQRSWVAPLAQVASASAEGPAVADKDTVTSTGNDGDDDDDDDEGGGGELKTIKLSI